MVAFIKLKAQNSIAISVNDLTLMGIIFHISLTNALEKVYLESV